MEDSGHARAVTKIASGARQSENRVFRGENAESIGRWPINIHVVSTSPAVWHDLCSGIIQNGAGKTSKTNMTQARRRSRDHISMATSGWTDC
jgi:hypothetical protein